MTSRFRGQFSPDEKERLEQAAQAVEKAQPYNATDRPAWAFLRFRMPYNGYPYWGVRLEDGTTVWAMTAEGLATSMMALRDTIIRKQNQSRQPERRTAAPFWDQLTS